AARATASAHFARKFDARRTGGLQRRLDLAAARDVQTSAEPLRAADGWDKAALQMVLLQLSGESVLPGVQPEQWHLEHSPGEPRLQRICHRQVCVIERLAAPPRFQEEAQDSAATTALLRFVLGIRIGVGWDSEKRVFTGPSSLLPLHAQGHHRAAVLYLSGRANYGPE
ncbi:unnamed protein product, partial [Symbiodinium pilosum]